MHEVKFVIYFKKIVNNNVTRFTINQIHCTKLILQCSNNTIHQTFYKQIQFFVNCNLKKEDIPVQGLFITRQTIIFIYKKNYLSIIKRVININFLRGFTYAHTIKKSQRLPRTFLTHFKDRIAIEIVLIFTMSNERCLWLVCFKNEYLRRSMLAPINLRILYS